MNFFRIGLAQINTVVGDIRGNGDKIIEYIKKAESAGAHLVVFPELTVTGYPPEDLLFKEGFVTANIEEVDRIASSAKNIAAAVGFVDRGESVFNAVGILESGKLKGVYRKIFLPNYGVFDEKRYFINGNDCPVFIIGGIRIGINICEDIWFEDGPAIWQSKIGRAVVLLNVSSSPYHMGKLLIRKKMLSQRAKENHIYLAYTNLVGGQDELVFDGSSLVLDPKGKIIAMGRQFEEELLLVDLPVGDISIVGRTAGKDKTDFVKPVSTFHKAGGRYHKKVPTITISAKTPKLHEKGVSLKKKRRMGVMEEVYSALTLGLRDYVSKNGFEKAVLGLSGGIDSALTATIAVDALGRDNVIGVTMPSRISSEGSITDSELLAKNLGIRMELIPINTIVDSYLGCMKSFFQDTSKGVTEENIQARIRGNIIMALSNKFSWLPLSTGNKSEVSTGYCTLYGDMAGGFAVIKDVPKTLVYRLAKYRNKIADFDIIPREVLEKEPSAELRPNQRDADSLPDYSILDTILRDYVENDRKVSWIAKKVGDIEMVKRIISMVDSNEYKRRQAPPGIKITPKAFGKDRRLPITNRFRG